MILKQRNEDLAVDSSFSIEELSEKFNIAEDILQILVNRGFNTESKLEEFLADDVSQIKDPFLLTDMRLAVDRINLAHKNKEQICIWGDYDVDGTSSSAILYLALKEKGHKTPLVYIPDRHKEGYGLNLEGAKKVIDKGVSLMITVDCGITSKDVVEFLVNNGVDVIVTDHHEVPEEIPYCTAVIDSHRPGEKYPYIDFCGAGIAFKLVQALYGLDFALNYIDIASFATVADVMPLTGENRAIVKLGLKAFNKNTRLGFKKLSKEVAADADEIKAYHYGFRLGPAINACGRLSHAKYAFKLLVSSDEEEAEKLAKYMHKLNQKRKEIENYIKEKAFLDAAKQSRKHCVISSGEGYNTGVIGIVASRVMEEFNKPAIVFSYDSKTGLYKGSARSIPGISMYKALNYASDYIYKWGGHDAAAGLTVKASDFYNFSNAVEEYMSRADKSLFTKTVKYDREVNLNVINEKFIDELKVFEPTGMGNPAPLFKVSKCSVNTERLMGSENQHFSCNINDINGDSLKAVSFNSAPPKDKINLDITFKPNINEYMGQKTIQLMINSISVPGEKYQGLIFNENISNFSLESLGVTKSKYNQFESQGITDTLSLLDFLPRKYLDYRNLTPVIQWEDKKDYAVVGRVISKKPFDSGKGFFVKCKDDENTIFLAMFFNQNFAYRMFKEGDVYFFSGKSSVNKIYPPSLSVTFYSQDAQKYQRLLPVYKKIRGMSDSYFQDKITKAMSYIENKEFLSEDILEQYDLMSRPMAIRSIHNPTSEEDIEFAKKRYLFDALFKFAFNLKLNRHNFEEKSDIVFSKKDLLLKVINELPYSLTNDQKNAVKQLVNKINTGNRLHALVQGDVGCGKTIVSLLMMACTFENNYQSALVAPTEVLAKQHYLDFTETLSKYGVKIEYLTGTTKKRDKTRILNGLKDGSVDMVIGTHAILQDSVKFKNIGLLVVDEEHKFGVAQREKIANTDAKPHLVTMSATPIPRTLALGLMGSSIEVITINEKPAGRKPIITKQVSNDSEVNKFLLSEINKGHQCYVVCPLINESDASKMKGVESVSKTVSKMKKWFSRYPTVKISDISGKMKKEEVEREIEKFKNNETQIIISTSIVEVGVNVPNATVMVLKSSERFGLAQAHQLRGRVGRGSAQGYMILQTYENEPKAQALLSSSDGFEIAKKDLKLRGAGDFLGTRQSGQNPDIMLMLANPDMFNNISDTVDNIFLSQEKINTYQKLLSC